MKDFKYEVCVVGGGGHVGLPLSIVFASEQIQTLIYDINPASLELIGEGQLPFFEEGAEELLRQTLQAKTLHLSQNPALISDAKHIIITIGTPVDEYLNPVYDVMIECFDGLLPHLSSDQTIILRSTVAPGVTEWLGRYLQSKGVRAEVAFCPERVVQGFAIQEIRSLPQIVSGITPLATERACSLFARIGVEIVYLEPVEAELAKLYCNAYRYIQFAASNQLAMMATHAGRDYSKILKAIKHNYPRMKDLPGAGFAAGPCLHKDTMQLAAFYKNQFSLGFEAMMINEGLPLFIIERLEAKYDLAQSTVGLLGMAFKANSDDIRSSLSYKMKKMLVPRVKNVLASDPLVKDDERLIGVEELIQQSDILILCTPHRIFEGIDLRQKPVIDIWNFFGKGMGL